MARLLVLSKIINALAMMRQSNPARMPSLQRLLAGVTAVLVLGFVAALLIGALVLGTCFVLYEHLVAQGMAPGMAQATLATLLVLLIIALCIGMVICVRNIQRKYRAPQDLPTLIANRVNGIASAFVDGLFAPRGRP